MSKNIYKISTFVITFVCLVSLGFADRYYIQQRTTQAQEDGWKNNQTLINVFMVAGAVYGFKQADLVVNTYKSSLSLMPPFIYLFDTVGGAICGGIIPSVFIVADGYIKDEITQKDKRIEVLKVRKIKSDENTFWLDQQNIVNELPKETESRRVELVD